MPLRRGLENLCHEHDRGLLLDRRIDPGRPLVVSIEAESVEAACRQVAEQLDLGMVVVGKNVYLGPRPAAARLATIIALRKDELAKASPTERKRWLSPKAWRWDELVTPRELLDVLAAEAGARLAGLDRLPHDLWAAGELKPLSLVERLSLIAVQFDLTYAWEAGGPTITLVPLPTEVAIERSYPGGKDPAALVERWARLAPESHVSLVEGRIVVRGSVEDHERLTHQAAARPAIAQPANPGKANSGKQPAAGSQQVHTLNVAEVSLDRLLAELEKKLSLSMRIDREAIGRAGIALNQRVSLRVERVTTVELFRKLLEPLGLAAKIDGTTVDIGPAKPEGPAKPASPAEL